MLKKYHVFISSSHDDLKSERLELTRIITELGAIPISMDNFDISQEEDRRIIRKAIKEADYFVNLTAYKGGESVGNSFALEIEYTWAIKAQVPVLALIVGEKARWKASKKEKDPAKAAAIESFKTKLKSHAYDSWINLGDLRHKALALISREMNLNPRRGWISSTEAIEPSVANELSRLIRENEILLSRIRMEGTDIVKKIQGQMKQALKILSGNRVSLSFYYTNSENWENPRAFRSLKLFRLLAPELSSPRTAGEISHFLGNILNPVPERNVRKDFPTPSNSIKKIMNDFSLLKLVKHSGSGENEAWEMTEYGKEAFSVYRLRQMHRNLQKKNEGKTAIDK